MILRSKIYLTVALALFCCDKLYCQSDSTTIQIYFNQGGESTSDKRAIDKLNNTFQAIQQDSLREITNISIDGFSSPEGSVAYNNELSHMRAIAIKNYLVEKIGIPDTLITMDAKGVAWEELERIILNKNHPFKEQVLQIIENYSPEHRDQQFKKIDNGSLYEYLFDDIYPRLRSSKVIVESHRLEAVAPYRYESPQLEEQTATSKTITTALEVKSSSTPTPLLTIKTNLLFDIATLVNLEIEIPIREHWSVSTELIFPWWTINNGLADSRRNRIQLINVNLEGRYWWRNASNPILTGWFCGVYTSLGSYDFEYKAKGYQGDFFVAAGVSGGYSHTINSAKNLRLEYSLGVGYLETNYKYYHAEFCNNSYWHAIEQRSGKYLWLGPTRAKVSLSWLINRR